VSCCADDILGSKSQHLKRIASTEDVDLTTVTVVGGDDGENKRLLTKVHGPWRETSPCCVSNSFFGFDFCNYFFKFSR